MLRKKRVLAITGVACILVASLSIVYVAASPAWTIDDLISYMEHIGQNKIWKTTYYVVNKIEPKVWLTTYIVRNQIKPKVDAIDEKMGQGLVGETEQGNLETVVGGTAWRPFVYFSFPDNPKKVSLWINLRDMKTGDRIGFNVLYDVDGDGYVEHPLDTKTRQFMGWEFEWPLEEPAAAVLIVDELPVTTTLRVDYYQTTGASFTLSWQTIVEEM